MNKTPQLEGIDHVIAGLDTALKSIFAKQSPKRKSPAAAGKIPEQDLSELERKKSIELMRVNHVGEICAQALYQGQALTARSAEVKDKMQEAAAEEVDHLSWCDERITELGGRTSLLNPIWYAGSLGLGTLAGLIGDKWSLGFLEETENQVEQHLAEHLDYLPENDQRSRAIVEQMKIDEAKHAQMANDNGAEELPTIIKSAMKNTANLMKVVAAKI